MDEQEQAPIEEQERQLRDRALQMKTGLLLGGVAGLGDLIFQGGWQGLAVGGVAVFLLARSSPEIAEQVKEKLAEVKEIYAEARAVLPWLNPTHYPASWIICVRNGGTCSEIISSAYCAAWT